MTRKRFMRMLMSTGIQRNMAWNLVKETRARGLSYADGFKSAYMTAVVHMCGWRTKKVTKAVREFGKAMAAAASSMDQLGAASREAIEKEHILVNRGYVGRETVRMAHGIVEDDDK